MGIVQEYREARRDEDRARLRRAIALRAMVASGMTQQQIAQELGVSQSAVSQQVKSVPDLSQVESSALLAAAAPVLRAVATAQGYTDLAVFGSIARREARPDSDIDLIVRAPAGTSSFGFVRFKGLLEEILGRPIDLVGYGGLTPGLDDDIRRDAVLL